MNSTATEKMKMVIFYSSVRQGRMNDRLGKFVKKVVEENGMQATVFDPQNKKFEMLKQPLHWMSKADQEAAPFWLKDANQVISQADAFMIVTTEYNCGVPPALANMLDHFNPESYRHRPCGVVTYSLGSFGGSRVSALITPMICELGMLTVPVPVIVPNVSEHFGENGECKSPRIAANISHLVKMTKWYAEGLKSHLLASRPPTKTQ